MYAFFEAFCYVTVGFYVAFEETICFYVTFEGIVWFAFGIVGVTTSCTVVFLSIAGVTGTGVTAGLMGKMTCV